MNDTICARVQAAEIVAELIKLHMEEHMDSYSAEMSAALVDELTQATRRALDNPYDVPAFLRKQAE